jgi:hypothetical protein
MMMLTRRHPLCLLLRNCWLCKPKYFRPWSKCKLLISRRHPCRWGYRLGDFQHSKSSTFSHAAELMDADDWLKSGEKVASDAMQQPWEFTANLSSALWSCSRLVRCLHGGPWGTREHQLARVQSCFSCTSCSPRSNQAKDQVSRSEIEVHVYERVYHQVHQLSRYAPNEVDTDEKKQDYFFNGLNDGLAYALEVWDFENFQEMVNKTLVLENRRGVMKCKCKPVRQHQSGSSSRPCGGTPSAEPMFHPAQSQFQLGPQSSWQVFVTPHRQVI